jgi:ABC-type multidrug transport system permease subunit
VKLTPWFSLKAIAAYSPNEYFAALANPIIVGAGLINFCGVVVPYSYMPTFWKYWMYWLDPFSYLLGGLLEPVVWSVNVQCKESELASIPLPSNTTCGEFMQDFLSSNSGYVVDPTNTTSCAYCPYTTGADYLKTFNINASYYGWRDVSLANMLPSVLPSPFHTSRILYAIASNPTNAGGHHGALLYQLVRPGLPDDEAEKQGHEDCFLIAKGALGAS